MSAKCRSCPTPIMWPTHVETRRANPLDAEPSPEGNCEVRKGVRERACDRLEKLIFEDSCAIFARPVTEREV
jgi:hypothetical protein